ncbi:hypothetical protein HRI_003207700 [Hibiscus trionum]|uniref:FRIGIDA-like protein n=1 Tax=Hibiscus trionum TaxID=183268 RepID=A0A9W7IEJ0_HIBTR|nr:hypothetical protein HRI_003207700 [Hibiscus trionum]
MVMANPSFPSFKPHYHATMLAAIKQEPLQSPSFLPPPTPIPPPLTTIKTEPDQQQPLQPPPSIPPPIPIPPPLATVKTEPDQPEQQQPLQSPPFLPPPIPIPPEQQQPLQSPSPQIPIRSPLATVKAEPNQPEQQQPLQSPPFLPPPEQQQPLQSPPFLPPQIPIPSPSATFKTEPDQPEQQQPLQSPPFFSPPIPIPPPLATTVITEPNQPEQQQLQEEPQLLKSINDLASHAAAVLAFKSKFDELTKHLDFINQAIDSKFNEPLHEEQHPQIEPQPQPYLKSTQIEAETVQKVAETAPPPKPSCGEIQKYCMWMKGKQVRKYIVKNLSNLPMLREEVPAALKLAPEPAKLVLDSVGEMILMGKKAYTNDPSSNQARRAILLLLEFFLSMMSGESRVKIAANVKVSAQNRAVALRKRLNKEGGLSNATAGDARGLLLYVACFGIPNAFTNQDLGTLLKLCNLRSISDAIKASPWLPGKMPDIIESMAKNGMHFEALEVVSIFGLEDEFSPKTILTLFLQESTKAFEREKEEAHNSPVELRKANEKRLGALKSIVHYLDYLEDRRSDAKELLGSWRIKEKIVKLEEEIPKPYKRIVKKKEQPKRKPDEMGSSSTGKSEEMKRSRFDTQGPALPKSHVNQLREQPTAILAEGEDLVPNSCPVASSAPHPGNGSGSGSGQMGGTTGVESSGIGVIPASSYSEADQMMSGSGLRCGWPQHSDMQSASTWFVGLFGSSLSIEGFVGLPDKSVRTLADLYRFADT